MKVLELFAGSRSIGKAAESLGYEVFSVDVKPFDNIDLVQDIEFLTPDQIPFKPTILWASIPCTTYSLAAISHHRNRDYSAKSDFAKKSDMLAMNTLKLIRHFNCTYYIENPRGVLSKMDYMNGIPRTMITYCSYGDIANKPTIIFSNNIHNPLFNPNGWKPRPVCPKYRYTANGDVINKHCHHEPAQRGSQTGTQGKKNNYERSKIPTELCLEILKASQSNEI